jgi:putative MATE family efflux protein
MHRTGYMLEAPVLPALLRLATPNVIVSLVTTFSGALDAFFVARLGSHALAGVSLVFPAWMLMVTMSVGGIGGGIASAIARALGARRQADANALVGHALLIGLGMAALSTAILLAAGPSLFRVMGGRGDVLLAAGAYSSVIFGGAIALWLVSTLASILRGTGDMVFPAVVVIGGELLHVVLAPTLIFGLGPAPALGVTGAGVSLVTSYSLRALALGGYLVAGRSVLTPSWAMFRVRPGLFTEILRVGLPASLGTLLTNLNVIGVTALAGTFGAVALAGYGIAARLEYLLIPVVAGLGTALVTMVGTNVGAGLPARAGRVVWTGAALAAAVTGSIGVVVAIVPRAWAGIFTSQPGVLATAEAYFHTVGPVYAFLGVGLALYFANQGAGRIGWPVATAVARIIVAQAGGAVAIHRLGGGMTGLAAAVALSVAVSGGGLMLATWRGFRRSAVIPHAQENELR